MLYIGSTWIYYLDNKQNIFLDGVSLNLECSTPFSISNRIIRKTKDISEKGSPAILVVDGDVNVEHMYAS